MKKLVFATAALFLATTAAVSPASAAVSFNETTFSTGDYIPTPTFNSGAGDILFGQCGTCGVGGTKALRFDTDFTGVGTVAVGVILSAFTYDTSAGAINSISFSGVKNTISSTTSAPIESHYRLLVQQGSSYFAADQVLGIFNPPVNTGFAPAGGTLSASDFLSFDFGTGTFGAANPNFSSGILKFGILQYSGSDGVSSSRLIYDNLSLSVTAVPEPATWAMMLTGFGFVSVGLRRRRKPTVRVTYA